MRKIFFTLSIILLAISTYSQTSLNDFKYVIVPEQFHFQTEPNQYRLNDLVKFMFKKVGFESFIEGSPLPDDLKNNYCLALRAEVISSGLLSTKSVITLFDCNKKAIFVSKEGLSREKELSKTYNLSLRDAFKSFESIDYKFNPNSIYNIDADSKTEEKEEIEKLKAEIKELKEEKKSEQVIDKTSEDKEINLESIVKEDNSKSEKVKKLIDKNDEGFTVKEIFNGYKLYDSSSKEAMTIFDSGVKDVFIVKGKDAIIYKKGNTWIYSETNETNLLSKIITIKF